MNQQDQVPDVAHAEATNQGFCPFSCCAAFFRQPFSGAMRPYIGPYLSFFVSFGLVVLAGLCILTILAGILSSLLSYWMA